MIYAEIVYEMDITLNCHLDTSFFEKHMLWFQRSGSSTPFWVGEYDTKEAAFEKAKEALMTILENKNSRTITVFIEDGSKGEIMTRFNLVNAVMIWKYFRREKLWSGERSWYEYKVIQIPYEDRFQPRVKQSIVKKTEAIEDVIAADNYARALL